MNDARFTIGAFDVAEVGRAGQGSVPVAVDGYWGADMLRLYVNRAGSWLDGAIAEWVVTLAHAAGGRDNNVIADDLDAETNFAHALLAAVELGRTIRESLTGELERHFQARIAEDAATEERARAEQQARIEADAPMGRETAEALVSLARATAQLSPKAGATIAGFDRGEAQPRHKLAFSMPQGRGGMVRLRMNGEVISVRDAVLALAEKSHRSFLVPAPSQCEIAGPLAAGEGAP